MKCEHCDFLGRENHELRVHMLIHEEPKFKCNICDYKCKYKYTLETHMRKCNGEKHNCDECNYVTHCPKILKVHKRNMHSEKRWHCEFCDYKTNQKQELENHTMQNHTMERPFKCDQCDFAAVSEIRLKIHKVGFEDSSLNERTVQFET